MNDLKLEYHYGNNADSYTFYRIPKMLFTDVRFEKLSVEAKVLYGLMLDRMALSIKNNWLDDLNRVYIYFTVEDACEMLKIGHTKMIRIFAELDTAKGIGLIERKKQGQGKPTIIYVKNFSSLEFVKTASEDKKSYPKPNFKTSESGKSDSDNSADNSEVEGDLTAKTDVSTDTSQADIPKAEVKTFAFETSRHSDNECADFQNMNANNTKINNTEFSDTQSIYPSISPFAQSVNIQDGLMDRISEDDLKYMVMDELIDEQTLPYTYIQDPRKMECAVKILCDYDRYADYARKEGMNDFRFSTIKLFAEALTEMLTTKENMNLKGSCVTYAKVYDKLIPFINFDSYEPFFLDLPDTVISDFETACKERHIKNHLAYMKSCIWNVLQVGDIGIQAIIKKDFG